MLKIDCWSLTVLTKIVLTNVIIGPTILFVSCTGTQVYSPVPVIVTLY